MVKKLKIDSNKIKRINVEKIWNLISIIRIRVHLRIDKIMGGIRIKIGWGELRTNKIRWRGKVDSNKSIDKF